MTYFKILKQTYMTHKTSLFEYVVRVYPIETKKGAAEVQAEPSSVRAAEVCGAFGGGLQSHDTFGFHVFSLSLHYILGRCKIFPNYQQI